MPHVDSPLRCRNIDTSSFTQTGFLLWSVLDWAHDLTPLFEDVLLQRVLPFQRETGDTIIAYVLHGSVLYVQYCASSEGREELPKSGSEGRQVPKSYAWEKRLYSFG